MAKKNPKDMSPEERKNIKIEFAPGAFDTFDGSQEELDELMEEIQKMILDGSLFEKARTVSLEDLVESDDPEDQELATKLLRSIDRDINGDDRNLQ